VAALGIAGCGSHRPENASAARDRARQPAPAHRTGGPAPARRRRDGRGHPPACDNPEVVDPTQGIVEWGTVDVSGPDLAATWVNDRPPGVTDGPFTANVG
jgi:hypothetical protein